MFPRMHDTTIVSPSQTEGSGVGGYGGYMPWGYGYDPYGAYGGGFGSFGGWGFDWNYGMAGPGKGYGKGYGAQAKPSHVSLVGGCRAKLWAGERVGEGLGEKGVCHQPKQPHSPRPHDRRASSQGFPGRKQRCLPPPTGGKPWWQGGGIGRG